jgi:hypothetical protein
MNLKIYLIFLVSIWAAGLGYAQLEQTQRLELPAPDGDDFEVISLKKDGLLLTRRKENFYGNEKWFFTHYDTHLKQQWESEHKLDFGIKPLMSYHNKDFLFWLFEESDTEKFQILRVDLHNGETDVFNGTFLTQPDVVHFKVLGSLALIGGYWHDRPTVLAYSFFDKTVKALPQLYTLNTEISNVEIDEQRNEINVILYTFKKNNCQFSIKTFSYDGHLTRTTNVAAEGENALISGKILPLDDIHSLLIGNYSQGCTQLSQGLYITRLQQGDPEKLQWIDFSQLENFFNYLKPRRKQKVVDKINKQKEEGHEPKFRYRMLVHDIVKQDNELILVAEIYYPSYRSANFRSSSNGMFLNGQKALKSDRNKEYDAYRYTHAIVCGFDPQTGKLLWDNCFAIKELESVELLQMIQVTAQNDKLLLGYPHDGKIHTEVIERNKILRAPESFDIKSANIDEKIVTNEDEQLTAWYDNFFVVYGFQKINPERNGPTREVFYVNKLRFDAEATKTSINK